MPIEAKNITPLIVRYMMANYPDTVDNLKKDKLFISFVKQHALLLARLCKDLFTHNIPLYLVEELIISYLQDELGPSRYNYITTFLSEHFEADYIQLVESYTLVSQAIQIITISAPTLNKLIQRNDEIDDPLLTQSLIESIGNYFNTRSYAL